MPDDPTGTHFLPPSYKVQEGDTVLPVQHNPPLEDLSQATSNRLHKDGRTAWTGNQNANGFKVTNLAPGTAANDAATVAQLEGEVGDFKDTLRDLSGGNYLRRDGSLHDVDDYPELAALLPPATTVIYNDESTGALNFFSARRVTATAVIMIAGTSGSNATVYTTVDAVTFVAQTLTGFTANYTTERNRAAFGNDLFAVNGRDGSNNHALWTASNRLGPWTKQDTIANGGSAGPMCFHDGYFYVARSPGGDPHEIWRTADGTSPTLVHTITTLVNIVDMISNGTEIIMLFTDGSGVRSTDGTSWSDINLPGTVTSLAWDVAAGVWVASAGASAAIFTSPDGLVWTTQSIETIFGDNRVHVGNYSQGLILVQTTAPYAAAVTAGDTNLIKVPNVPFSNTWSSRAITQAPQAGTELLIGGSAGEIIWAAVTPLPGQFRTPIDNPAYGWVKAKES